MEDIIIIGAGVVGSFLARNLARYDLKTLVIEKDLDGADEATMANSAICHSGYDPEPGTLKALLNVRGNSLMEGICADLDVPYERCGTLTVALSEEERPALEALLARAGVNGVPARILEREELRALEPNISKEAVAALLCPTGGIVNPFLLALHALENAVDNGVRLSLGEEVTGLKKIDGGWEVTTTKGVHEAKLVLNAAGTHSDLIAKMAGPIDWSIKPRKGEYFVLNHYAKGLVNHVIFALPTKKGKGVLVTMTTSGNYLVGPSSEEVPDRDDLSTDPATLGAVREQALRLIPSIPFREGIRVYSGMRATPSTHDFVLGPLNGDPSFINAAGIESPGLVSSPAIGEYVVEQFVVPYLKPAANPAYNPKIKPYTHPQSMSPEERDALIKEHPSFGHILCDCEMVSLGEMEEALSRSVPCLTVKAMKKRTRAGFGKCQGGFCQAKVLTLLSKAQHRDITEISYGKPDSPIFPFKARKGETK